MQGLDKILASSGMDLAGLGERFGLSPEQATAAMSSLMPAVAGGIRKRADENDLQPVTDAAGGMAQPDTASGNAILGHIFGSKDVSRQVADHAAGQSGLSSTVMKAMLPVVAAIVAKHVASSSGGGGLGNLLGTMLGGTAGGSSGLGGMLGAGASAGNPLDRILAGFR